jgi:hypothetical protein
MRIFALAAVLAFAAASTGCSSDKGAAAPVGTAAGDVVGGVAWVGMKGAGLAWKGGKYAAKVTGKTVVGAAKGVHEEFSKPDNPPPSTTKTAAATSGPSGTLSQQ